MSGLGLWLSRVYERLGHLLSPMLRLKMPGPARACSQRSWCRRLLRRLKEKTQRLVRHRRVVESKAKSESEMLERIGAWHLGSLAHFGPQSLGPALKP